VPDDRSATPAILIVDDERPIVDLLTRYLGQRGFRVLGAASAAEARGLVGADAGIAVVLSDVRMPGESGVALAEELMAGRPEAAAIEVVLVSGAGLPDSDAGIAARAFAVLRKPFRPSEVAAAATQALASSQRRRAEAANGAPAPPAVLAPREPSALRPAAPERLRETMQAMAEGLRAPLLPILDAAERLASGEVLSEAELREQGLRVRAEALRLMAMIDAAVRAEQEAPTEPPRRPGPAPARLAC
jgi:CheY-like chemotaxis protein